MYNKNCIYDYLELQISDDAYESETSNILRFIIPSGAYYDMQRGPVCSVALVSGVMNDATISNYSVKWMNPAFNSYNTENDGLEIGTFVFLKTSNATNYHRINPTETIEIMTTPKPNNIRFTVVDENGDYVRIDKGYFIFRFTYYDPEEINKNLLNERYKLI